MQENVEHAKLEFEKTRVEAELKLKAEELALKQAEMEFRLEAEIQKPFSSSPLIIALITGIIGFLSVGIANYMQSRANLTLEREKFESTANLEREKFESSLILKAIETGNPDAAAKNLLFMMRVGLIHDRTGKIAALEGRPENAPVLPSNAFGGKGGDCGVWRSTTSGKRYYFICQDESSFDVFEDDPNQGLIKIGSGRILQDRVEANLYVRDKGRTANLDLKLSDDRHQLEGNFQGVDTRFC
jgi:hypothetical protein